MADKITEAVRATPYAKAPSIWIAYPQPLDWMRVFDPVLDPKTARRPKYEDMKSRHEADVKKQLDIIFSSSVGQTVLMSFRARAVYSVMILPFVFQDDPGKAVAATVATEGYAATAKGTLLLDREGLSLDQEGEPICDITFDGRKICKGTGTGSSVDIYFVKANPLGISYTTRETEDEILLHELVHALRFVWGVDHPKAVTGEGGYHNQEEFFAVLVANMYRSEKPRPLFDFRQHNFEAARFLDTGTSPSPRSLIRGLRDDHRSLFDALKDSQAPFNPVRQIDSELRQRH